MIWSPTIETLENGSVAVTNFPATQPVSAVDLDIRDINSATDSITAVGPLTDAQLRATPVPVTQGSAASATITNVGVSTTVATLAAANASRIKLYIVNEAGTLLVKLGAAASNTSYSLRINAGANLEITGYTGIVTAIKVSGSSSALVTEL
jgi:uncharacterized protein with WD repeat